MITDAAIRKALKAGKFARLVDPAPRGTGRLLAVVKPPELVEWYAQRIVNGSRRLTKLGTWPALSIADARERFKDKAAGRAGTTPAARATLDAMADGYIASLRAAGKPSVAQAEKVLKAACREIGGSRLARDIEPHDVVAFIRPIFERGARVQADKHRMYLGAAFRWAMRATHDYRAEAPMNWGIKVNPVDAITRDTEAEGVGTRWLSEAEFRALLRYLDSPLPSRRTRVVEALQLLLLTGQRVREVLALRAENWDSGEQLLKWPKTKNGLPHAIPVCRQAAKVLDGLRPGAGGWLFPNEAGPETHMPDGTVLMWLRRYTAERKMERVTGRDLRRTWKTLAGSAGLTKVERDLLQNHTESDVSARHYDRWQYLPEKRAAVGKWEAWLERKQLRQDHADPHAHEVVDGDQQRGRQGLVAHAPSTIRQSTARKRTA